jgi:hypothetical protein
MAMLRQDWPALATLADEADELQSRTSLWGAAWARVMQLAPLHCALGSVPTVVDDVVRIAHLRGMDATRPLAAIAVTVAGDTIWWSPAPRWCAGDPCTRSWPTSPGVLGDEDGVRRHRALADQRAGSAAR